MTIKYGSIEYFTLLDLEDKLKSWKYNKLDLLTLDTLRAEVEMKIKAINYENTTRITKTAKND
jgi:predicted nucleotidyltransferase